jgi:hypothetical protein
MDKKLIKLSFWRLFRNTCFILVVLPLFLIGLQWTTFNYGGDLAALFSVYFLLFPYLFYLYPPSWVFGDKIIGTEGMGTLSNVSDCLYAALFYLAISALIAGLIYITKKRANQELERTVKTPV